MATWRAWTTWRWARRAPGCAQLGIGSAAVGALAGWLFWWCAPTAMHACEHEVRHGQPERGIARCLASYQDTGDPRYLVWAADAHLMRGELDAADVLARQLTEAHPGDAHRIQSYTALRRGRIDDARAHANIARFIHRLVGDWRGLANDAVSLSQIAWRTGDFAAALHAADEALELAPAIDDRHIEWRAHVARADALRRMGDIGDAMTALATASQRSTQPCDIAWSLLKYAMSRMEAGQEAGALLELDRADTANQRCGSEDIRSQIALNQAWLLRRDRPSKSLARLDEVEAIEGEMLEAQLLRSYLAADRDDLGAAAAGHLSAAARLEPPDADWPWELERAWAELSALRGGLFDGALAELRYRRAIALVDGLRPAARDRSAHFVASHRGPYDGLIALLAAQGRWRDVLGVVLALDASDMLRATADEVRTRDRVALADGPPAPPRAVPTVDEVVQAWRSRDLVIVIAPARRSIGGGRERAVRLRIVGGQVTGEHVGDAAAVRTWSDDLFEDPGNARAARALGRVIVPDGTGEVLHVLAIGPLGKAPLASLLEEDGSLTTARRPLVRVLALHTTSAESTVATPPAIIADPLGDLPAAAAEGVAVATLVGADAQVSGAGTGVPATRARLWAAQHAELLHVAGHVHRRGHQRALRLVDGDVDAAEIVRRRLAPRFAVIAGCGSAAATDEEGWGSIAAALLEAGTAVVIATDRTIRDDDALSIMRDFYAQPDWRTAPARALARVQQSSGEHGMKPRSWGAFTVLERPPAVATGSTP